MTVIKRNNRKLLSPCQLLVLCNKKNYVIKKEYHAKELFGVLDTKEFKFYRSENIFMYSNCRMRLIVRKKTQNTELILFYVFIISMARFRVWFNLTI